MSQQLHAQANAVLYQALEQEPAERHRFIEQACAGCRELFQLVSSMLSHIDQLDAFLHEPLAASLDEAPAASRPGVGARIGPWRVVRELERGRLGHILLVEHTGTAAAPIAALKIVDAAALSLEQLALFHRQRQLLASLTHPDIARLADSGALPGGEPYVVLEYSDGQPIDAFCSDSGATRETRIALMARVCDAVHHGHQHLVLHRHLEPASILVERDGTLKVSDFGVSALLDAAPSNATTADDIGALGALLRKLLLDEGGRLPRALERIVDKAASSDPRAQYGSADELAQALRGYLMPAPHVVAEEPPPAPARGVLARGLSAALLVALGIGATLGWQRLQPKPLTHPVKPALAAGRPAPNPPPARPAVQEKSPSGAATAQAHLERAHGLVASGAYAAADAEFKLARESVAKAPASRAQRLALAEIELARADAQYRRKHWRTAGQTVRAMRAALPADAGQALGARAALLEALIQPGGTATQAYAAARTALPVVTAYFESDRAAIDKLADSALAWRRTGEIAARAGQASAACQYYREAEQRYLRLERAGRLGAAVQGARQELGILRSKC